MLMWPIARIPSEVTNVLVTTATVEMASRVMVNTTDN